MYEIFKDTYFEEHLQTTASVFDFPSSDCYDDVAC